MKYFKKLVGERIYLSPRNVEDVEIFTEWMNDFEVTDYIGRTAQMISLSWEKEYLEKNANPESTFVIVAPPGRYPHVLIKSNLILSADIAESS